MKRPAVFLDRDGTINVDKDYLFQIDECEYIPGAVEALRALSDSGYILIIITNQSGIARGYYTEDDYHFFMNWMINDLKDKGINISGHYYCPHLPGAKIKKYDLDCPCRKPKTELFFKAAEEHEIDLSRSFAIGDKLRDLAICKETDVKGVLLGSRADIEDEAFTYNKSVNWDDALRYILKK